MSEEPARWLTPDIPPNLPNGPRGWRRSKKLSFISRLSHILAFLIVLMYASVLGFGTGTGETTSPPKPEKVCGLKAVSGISSIEVTWNKPAADATITGYTLQVSDDGNTGWIILCDDIDPKKPKYHHTDLLAGTTKHYRVRAYNEGGGGPWSEHAKGTAGDSDDKTVLSLLRANATAGVVLANSTHRLNLQAPAQAGSNEPFTKANLYMALDLMPAIVDPERECVVDPIVNIRLSSVGVKTSTGDASGGFDSSAFIQSQKAATIHLGGVVGRYFPVAALGSNDRYQWSGGFIGRYVLQSITGSEKALRIWDVDDIYSAYTFGGRFSLMDKAKRNTWSPVFYVDVSYGKFENYEIATPLTPNAMKCARDIQKCRTMPTKRRGPPLISMIEEKDFTRKRPWRTYIESRLYLKGIHFGFDLNNGEGIDDLRFIFGVSRNLEDLFGALVK